MADKIAYLSRDIEDALSLNLLEEEKVDTLLCQIKQLWPNIKSLDNGTLVHYFIMDVCEHSSIENGICLSQSAYELMKILMSFNYKNIYLTKRLKVFERYVSMMIESVFEILFDIEVVDDLKESLAPYPLLGKYYIKWVDEYKNTLYDYSNEKDRVQSILDFIAGMTDPFLIRVFNELISFH